MAPNLAVTLGDLVHPSLRLGCVSEGEAGEESHDVLLLGEWEHWLNSFASVYNTS